MSSAPRSTRHRPGAPLFAALLAVGGCRSPHPTTGEIRLPAPIQVSTGQSRVPAELAPALEALRAAVEDGDDAVARRILSRLSARAPQDPGTLRLLRGFERILAGRKLVAALDLRLRIEETDEADPTRRRHRLLLDARQDLDSTIVISFPPAPLERLRVSIDPLGDQAKGYETSAVQVLTGIRLPPGRTTSILLAEVELPIGTALAVREQWRLRLYAGEIFREGEEPLPASHVAVEPVESTVLAPYLPPEPIDPSELIAYVRSATIHLPALIERAVRIDPSRRAEALAELAPVVEELARNDPGRIEVIAPALRWLARVVEPGTDWPQLLRSGGSRNAAAKSRRSALDLPATAPPRGHTPAPEDP